MINIFSKLIYWDRGISEFDLQYIRHRWWVYDAWRWLIQIDMEIDDEIKYRYWDFQDWMRLCWNWNPDSIRFKGTYDMGDCSRCEHLVNDTYLCLIQSFKEQDDFYWDWESFEPITPEKIKCLTCPVFSERRVSE